MWRERKSSQPEGEHGLARAVRPRLPWRAAGVFSLGLALWFLPGNGRAQESQPSQPSEYQLKAAFIFNFAKFVEWPPEAFAEPTSPFVIGILGEDPFGNDLERTVRNKTVKNRPLATKQIRNLAEAKNCHILFISTSEKKRLPEILESLRGVKVLTVGETDRFVETGGMIHLIKESDQIRFRINDRAAKGAGLKISSKLLSLALPPVL
jgi:hypothetical protein